MNRKRVCPLCKRGVLKYVGDNLYECTVCIRGTIYAKKSKKRGELNA